MSLPQPRGGRREPGRPAAAGAIAGGTPPQLRVSVPGGPAALRPRFSPVSSESGCPESEPRPLLARRLRGFPDRALRLRRLQKCFLSRKEVLGALSQRRGREWGSPGTVLPLGI